MQDIEGAADRAALAQALSALADRLDRTEAGRAWRQLLARTDLAEFRETSGFEQVHRNLLHRLGATSSVALAYEQVLLAAYALDAVLRSGRGEGAKSPQTRPQAPPPLPATAALSAKVREPPRPPPRLMDALARARVPDAPASGRFDELGAPSPRADHAPVTDPARLTQLEDEINRVFREPSAAPLPVQKSSRPAASEGELDVEEADVDIVVRGNSSGERRDAPAIRPGSHSPPRLRSARRTGPEDGRRKPERLEEDEATVEIVRPVPPEHLQASPEVSAHAAAPPKPLPPPRKP